MNSDVKELGSVSSGTTGLEETVGQSQEEDPSFDEVVPPFNQSNFLLGSLHSTRFRVQRPFQVIVERGPDGFVAEIRSIKEFGAGDTWSEAIRNLQRAVDELAAELFAERDRLGTDLSETLRILEAHLTKVW